MTFRVQILAVFLAITGMVITGVHAEEKSVPTISVSGKGKVDVAPDMAIITVGVLREAKTARGALDANNKAMAAVLTALEEQGIERKDLQTSNFNIQPKYVYPKAGSDGQREPPLIVGYTVSNTLDVRVRDIDKTGEIMDLVVTLGVNSGGNIRFSNQDTDEILEKARIKAVKDAMSKASTILETAGAKLGQILTITENFQQPRPIPIAQARSFAVQEAAADSVPVAGGENSYQVTVNISWQIEQ